VRGPIVYQQDRQAVRLFCNKCRGSTAQRPCVRLRPLAYVTGDIPRDSIGPPLERGAEVYVVWSGHVSAPDTRLALIKAWVFFVRESRDPAEGVRTSLRGVQIPPKGSGLLTWESRSVLEGPG
jgi:hypothetical protein